jgi:hypothetical protein
MRVLTESEIRRVGGGDDNSCTWDVVVGYVGATAAFTMVGGPIGFAFASVMWFAAATSMHNNC